MSIGIERFTELALEDYHICAMWSSLAYGPDETCDPISADKLFNWDDVDQDLRDEYDQDLRAFIADNWDDVRGLDAGQVGHDFWLTRNGHGAGFWDRGLGEVGERLTAACRPYGETDLGLYYTSDMLNNARSNVTGDA